MRPAGLGRGPETHIVMGPWEWASVTAAWGGDGLLVASRRYQPELPEAEREWIRRIREVSQGTVELWDSQVSGREESRKVLGLQWQLVEVLAYSTQ